MTECDRNHFRGVCDYCDARALATRTLAEAEHDYHTGQITYQQFAAYRHVWATETPRLRIYGWETPPTDPRIIEQVDLLRDAARRRKTAESRNT